MMMIIELNCDDIGPKSCKSKFRNELFTKTP